MADRKGKHRNADFGIWHVYEITVHINIMSQSSGLRNKVNFQAQPIRQVFRILRC